MCIKVKNYLYQTKIKNLFSILFINVKPIKNTFHKQERLCSKKQMELLFNKGSSKLAYPIKLQFLETPVDLEYPVQGMFVAPKRSFKKAHDRNKLKRRMREVYRLNKSAFYETLISKNKKYILAFIYIGKKIEEYDIIEKSILKLLNHI